MERERKLTQKKCQNCGKVWMAKNKSAKFCSAYCRQETFIKNKNKRKASEIEKELDELNKVVRGLSILVNGNSKLGQGELNKLFEDKKVDKDMFQLITTLRAKIEFNKDELTKL